MTRYQTQTLALLSLFLVGSCGGGETPPPTPTPESPAPGKAALSLPGNNRACEAGQISGDNASVVFSWSAASNATTYDLLVTNLDTSQNTSRTGISANSVTIPLTRGHRYSWKVTAKNTGSKTTDSDTWKFYLAGEGAQNAAPFPAEAITPVPGSTVNVSSTGTVQLSWTAEDADEDVLTYEIQIDTVDGNSPATESLSNLSHPSIAVPVSSGKIYYWRVISSDRTASVASDVFSFRVN